MVGLILFSLLLLTGIVMICIALVSKDNDLAALLAFGVAISVGAVIGIWNCGREEGQKTITDNMILYDVVVDKLVITPTDTITVYKLEF